MEISIATASQFQPGQIVEFDTGDGKKRQCKVTKIIDGTTLQLTELTVSDMFQKRAPDAMIRPRKEARIEPIRRGDAPYKDIE